jgi:hypothetical protein
MNLVIGRAPNLCRTATHSRDQDSPATSVSPHLCNCLSTRYSKRKSGLILLFLAQRYLSSINPVNLKVAAVSLFD